MRSPGVWAPCVAGFAFCWSFYLCLTEIPSYLASFVGLSVKEAGCLGFLPFLAVYLVTTGTGFVADWLLRTRRMDLRSVRVCFFTTGICLSAVSLVVVALLPRSAKSLIIVIIVSPVISL